MEKTNKQNGAREIERQQKKKKLFLYGSELLWDSLEQVYLNDLIVCSILQPTNGPMLQ